MRVAILGAGVIGSAIAYYLALRGIGALIIERTGVACAASGKSGGFLARDWCRGQAQEALAEFSFDLHTDLAAGFGDAYGYRRVDTFAAATSERRARAPRAGGAPAAWMDGTYALQQLGDTNSTAQLHPARFTETLLDAACDQGARLHKGTVEEIVTQAGKVSAVMVDGKRIAVDRVVVAMGPWSVLAAQWLPLPAVYGLKGYSIVLRPTAPLPAHALFLDHEDEAGETHAPELITRADGDVYVCGFSDTAALPLSPADVSVDDQACDRLAEMAAGVSSRLQGASVVARQACYRPICEDAMPLIGAIPDTEGAYVATGHNCWGMLNAPGTGYAVAELITQADTTVPMVSALGPARLGTLRFA